LSGTADPGTDRTDEIRAHELSGVFAVPRWLRDLGLIAWLLVGLTLLVVGLVTLLALTHTIVMPVLTAAILAAVLSPLAGALRRRGVPGGLAAALLLLAVVLVAIGLIVLILTGVGSQVDALGDQLRAATAKLSGYLSDAGVDAGHAASATDDAGTATSDAVGALLAGIAGGLTALASLAIFLSFTALSLFFLLKDGAEIRAWTERHMGIPRSIAHAATGRTLESLRGYFLGVTFVALFNAIVIGLGALVLDVPNAGSIALVNFAAAYIPYLGAWSAGVFTVLIALGGQGPEIALAMAVITLLANGTLQQLVQPIAFGATLDVHPLGVLIVTIAGGALFGAVGLILAAPLTSATLKISGDVARARALESADTPPHERTTQ
jgi:predicted PurR-regulated permease PerM